MALELFKLVGSIFVDSTEADKSISNTDKKAGNFGNTLVEGTKKAAKWGAAIVTGASAAVSGITAFATKSASACDEIDKMSQRLGLSREAYQELDFVLSQSGVEINSFQTGVKTLTANMDKVTEGNKTAQENFQKLGVCVTDINGNLKSQEETLFETVAAFQKMEDGTEKARLAQELFGKQGQEIMPLLNAQSGSLEDMRKQAQDLGLVLSDDTVDAGVKLTDTIDQLKRSFSSIFTSIGADVMPIVQKFAEMIIGAIPQIRMCLSQLSPIITQLFSQLVPPLMELTQIFFPILISLFEELIPPATEMITSILPVIILLIENILPLMLQIITAIMPVIIELVSKIIPPLLQFLEAVLPPLILAIESLIPIFETIINLLTPIIDLFVSLLLPISNLIEIGIAPLIQIFSKLTNGILKIAIPIIEALAYVLANILAGAIDFISEGIIGKLIGAFSGLIDFIQGVFTGNWKKALNGLKDIVSGIFSAMVTIVKAPINALISLINIFIRGLNLIKIPDWVPGIGGMGINFPEIKHFAGGGTVEKGDLFYANEEEPELITSGGKNTVIVNNKQIIAAVVSGVTEGVNNAMHKVISAIEKSSDSTEGGDIFIPVYIAGEQIDEILITRKQVLNFKSGGRANA